MARPKTTYSGTAKSPGSGAVRLSSSTTKRSSGGGGSTPSTYSSEEQAVIRAAEEAAQASLTTEARTSLIQSYRQAQSQGYSPTVDSINPLSATNAARSRTSRSSSSRPSSSIQSLGPQSRMDEVYTPQAGSKIVKKQSQPTLGKATKELWEVIRPTKTEAALMTATVGLALIPFEGPLGEAATGTALASSYAQRGAKIAKAAKTTATAARIASKSRLATFGVGALRTFLIGESARIGVQKGASLAASKEQKEILKDTGKFKEAIQAGFSAEQKKVAGESWYKSLAYEIPIANYWVGDKKEFEKAVTEQFKSQGYSGKKLDTAVQTAMRERKVRTAAEATSFVASSASVERLGRKLLTQDIEKAASKGLSIPKKQAFTEFFKRTAMSTGPAGIVEGAVQEYTQEKARERPVSAKNIAIMGATGGVSAGLIGGVIGGLKVPKPGVSKVVEYSTYIVDPFEKPGDIVADISVAAEKKLLKRNIELPKIYETIAPEDLLNVGKKAGKKAGNVAKGASKRIPILTFAPTLTPTQTATTTKTATDIISPRKTKPISPVDIFGPFTPSDTPTPVPINTPDIVTPVDVPTLTDVFAETLTPVPTTTTSVSTSITIPTVTPQLRIPPPLPIMFPAGSSTGYSRKGKKLKYEDELKQSQKLLKKLIGGFG